MIKALIIPSTAVLIVCALLSSWSNYQDPTIESKQRKFLNIASQPKPKNNWADVLAQLPQYKKAVDVNTAPQVEQLPKISDSKVIGIIVDQPKSVLLLIENQTEITPKQLTIGDSWLEDWIIQDISADSITWVNTQTQQSYIQTLFAAPTVNSEDLMPKTGTQ